MEKEIVTLEDLKEKIFTDVDSDSKNEFLKKEKLTKKYNKEEKIFDDRIAQFIFEVGNKKGNVTKFESGFIALTNKYPNITRMMLYKMYAPEGKFDCDATESVLEKLVPFLPKDSDEDNKCKVVKQGFGKYKYEIKVMQNNIQRTYRGDTMNSFWGLFKSFLQNCCHEELGLVGKSVPENHRIFGNGFESWIYYICVKYSENNKNNEIFNENNKNILGKFNDFAELNHTIGNFILVPYVTGYSYNTARNSKFNDCFDLSLNDIKNVFNANIHSGIIMADIHFWIESYGYGKTRFEIFIKENHLEMYVDKNYNVKPLYSDVDRENKIPKAQTEIENYLDNVIANIKARNEVISNFKKTQTVEKTTD